MLFSTQLFILVFLPFVLGGYHLAARDDRHIGADARKWLVIAASLWFYGYWDVRLLPLLISSILVNWLFARLYGSTRKYLVAVGVVLNLLVLGVFKYANFFADTFAFLFGYEHDRWHIVLPLAISFFTFQQISYLVDIRRSNAPVYRFVDYAFYVSFFPQLIAGPIVRHHEIIPQFSLDPYRDGLDERLARGMTLFIIGLVKKTFFADPLGQMANPLFDLAASDSPLNFAEAWTATFAYTFQLYFDFSSYSDMAIGMGLMFGFSLPLNFNSPYKATSIRDFWRRWHMTLTRFMRDYVYTPIGLRLPRRYKRLREAAATMVTMVLIGLWHGAAWSYVVFGMFHGAALVINQAWRRRGLQLWSGSGWFLTFMFVALTLVLFRSESFQISLEMWSVMFGSDGMSATVKDLDLDDSVLILLAALITFLAPNSQAIALEWLRPRRLVALTAGAALVAVLLQVGVGQSMEFIYFQF